MSTAIVSSPFVDFRDVLYKNPPTLSSKSHLKSMMMDCKAVGAPLGYSRRHSTNTTTATIHFATNNFSENLSKINASSILSVNNDSCSSSLNSLNNTPSSVNNSSANLLSINAGAPITTHHRKLDRSFSEPVNTAVNLLTAGLVAQSALVTATNNAQSATVAAQLSPQQQPQQQPGQGNSSRYKTELCRPYEESGTCKYGDKCQFAHGGHELRTLARHPKYKTELCRTFHTTGFCPYGPRCHFIHNADESRKNSTSSCDSSSSSDSSDSSDSSSGSHSPPPSSNNNTIPRPKAFSVGSFSPEHSPPSSLSESPTNSTGSFFEEQDPFVSGGAFHSVSQPATPTANNAFTYSTQEFTSALVASSTNNNNNVFNNNNNNNNAVLLNNKFMMHRQLMINRAVNGSSRMILERGGVNNNSAILVAANNAINGVGGCKSANSNISILDEDVELHREERCCCNNEEVEEKVLAEVEDLSGEFDRRLRLPIFSQLSHCDDM